MRQITAILMFVAAVLGASHVGAQGRVQIGSNYAGGIVFYVDGTGQHGLVAAAADQGKDVRWEEANQTVRNYRGGGFADWRIPSKAELNALWQQKSVVGGFRYDDLAIYWTSTDGGQDNHNNVWLQNFSNGDQYGLKGKSNYCSVRAIRSF